MWNSLLNAVGAAGNVLDLPGSSARDVLAGRNPLDQWMTPLTDKNRTSGRDLLRVHGLAGSKDTWGNFAGGMLAEAAMDPLNFIPGMSVAKAARAKGAAQAANRGIDTANALSMSQRAAGFMPEEVIPHLHPSVLESPGVPKKFYHGTTKVYDTVDPSKWDQHATVGPGHYMTDAKGDIPSGYAGVDSHVSESDMPWLRDQLERQNRTPIVKMHYADVRHPMNIDANRQEWREILDTVRPLNERGDVSGLVDYVQVHDLLKKRGYDAIQHEGGFGSQAHNVTVAMSPEQVYLPYIAKAIQPRQAVPKITPAMMRLAMYNAAARTAAQGGRSK